MNLLEGFIASTLDQVNHVSQHSMLMRFYALEREIEHEYDTKSYKECFHNLSLYFMEIEARAILRALNII